MVSGSKEASDPDALTNIGVEVGVPGGVAGNAFQFDNTPGDTLTASTSYSANAPGTSDLGGTTTATTYIDGALAGSDSALIADLGALVPGLEDSGINFGRARTPASDRPFDGLIDEIGIWDRELTGAEITEAFTRGSNGQALIPEPSVPALLALAISAVFLRRQRR